MINRLNLIRNIGCFDSVDTAANLRLEKLTLIYAENGRGKTTLSAILRSLATGNPIPINERKRFAASHDPHAVVSCIGSPPDAIFQNGQWNRTLADIVIFDDMFVNDNVYSGLVVSSGHRQHLHELILGSRGVTLNQQLQEHVARIEIHNTKIRQCADAIPSSTRENIPINDFCALKVNPNIDKEIKTAEQNLAASQQQDSIRNTPEFLQLTLPNIDIPSIEAVLKSNMSDLDATATARVQDHLQKIGSDSEQWIADGMKRQKILQDDGDNTCAFCAQNISGSPVIIHYRAFFGDAYRNHQQSILAAAVGYSQEHFATATLSFERAVNALRDQHRFWSKFGGFSDITIDSVAVIADWDAAWKSIAQLLTQKKAAPLDPIDISEAIHSVVTAYSARLEEIVALNKEITAANQLIVTIKQRAATAVTAELRSTLATLKATKTRHSTTITPLCDAYLNEIQAKATVELLRAQARQNLDNYRTQIFPTYETAINRYLHKFGTGFQLANTKAANTRGGSTCTYNVVINNTSVTVGSGSSEPDTPSFRNVLSAGDRNALAVAFFLASIELDPNPENKVVVIDDPVSSLDEHRSLTTVQEIRRLLARVNQVVILSHSKSFLCRIWGNSNLTSQTALQIVRQGAASTISTWDVNRDSITENDRRHEVLRDYLANGGQNERDVAQSIRPTLEAFLRVAYPIDFPPSTFLGQFRTICTQRVGTSQKILCQDDIDELSAIIEYINPFHHDTNSALETETVNRRELEGFIKRALNFAKRPLSEQ